MKRQEDTGQLVYEIQTKKPRVDMTRKRKKEEIPSVSVPLSVPVVEEKKGDSSALPMEEKIDEELP
jgi:hypothetical protein